MNAQYFTKAHNSDVLQTVLNLLKFCGLAEKTVKQSQLLYCGKRE